MNMGPLFSARISISFNIPLMPNPVSVNLINPKQKLNLPNRFFALLLSVFLQKFVALGLAWFGQLPRGDPQGCTQG